MRDTAREERVSLLAMYFCGAPHGQAKVEWPARPYLQQLCTDTGCSMEDLSREMDDRDEWWERVKEFRASGTPWW